MTEGLLHIKFGDGGEQGKDGQKVAGTISLAARSGSCIRETCPLCY